MEQENQQLKGENQELKGENQELKGTVETMQNTMDEIESEKQTLKNEKQTLQTQNETLQNELDKNIISMVQMALEYGLDEISAIQKIAEKCNADEDYVTKLWNAHNKTEKYK